MLRTYDELKTVLVERFCLHEITVKDFEENYPHYSLYGDTSIILKYLKGIFVDVSGKVNRRNDPFVLIVFARDDKVVGQRLNGGPEVVPIGLFDVLEEIEYEKIEE